MTADPTTTRGNQLVPVHRRKGRARMPIQDAEGGGEEPGLVGVEVGGATTRIRGVAVDRVGAQRPQVGTEDAEERRVGGWLRCDRQRVDPPQRPVRQHGIASGGVDQQDAGTRPSGDHPLGFVADLVGARVRRPRQHRRLGEFESRAHSDGPFRTYSKRSPASICSTSLSSTRCSTPPRTTPSTMSLVCDGEPPVSVGSTSRSAMAYP